MVTSFIDDHPWLRFSNIRRIGKTVSWEHIPSRYLGLLVMVMESTEGRSNITEGIVGDLMAIGYPKKSTCVGQEPQVPQAEGQGHWHSPPSPGRDLGTALAISPPLT
jgi:hypothetical protein